MPPFVSMAPRSADVMLQILSITAPIFIVIGLGFIAAMSRLVTREQLRGMGSFVITLALPALIIKGMAQSAIHEIVNPQFLIAYSAGSLASFAAAFLVFRKRGKQSRATSSMAGLGVSASNSGFIGYPIVAMAVGAPAAVGVAMAIMVETLLIIPLAQTLAETDQNHATSRLNNLLQTARRLAKSPLIIAITVGLLISLFELRLPEIGLKVIDMLASASAPVALFVIGGTLYGLKARGLMADVAKIALGKLLLHPAAMFAAFLLVPAIDPALKTAGILFASAPMLSIYPVFGLRYGMEERCAAALLVSTILSFLTITFWIAILT